MGGYYAITIRNSQSSIGNYVGLYMVGLSGLGVSLFVCFGRGAQSDTEHETLRVTRVHVQGFRLRGLGFRVPGLELSLGFLV